MKRFSNRCHRKRVANRFEVIPFSYTLVFIAISHFAIWSGLFGLSNAPFYFSREVANCGQILQATQQSALLEQLTLQSSATASAAQFAQLIVLNEALKAQIRKVFRVLQALQASIKDACGEGGGKEALLKKSSADSLFSALSRRACVIDSASEEEGAATSKCLATALVQVL